MNNKIKILFTTVVVSLCMFLSAVFSATPNKVNYQGVLKEKGQLVTGTRKMKFAIYDTPTGGNPKWTSGEVNVQVNGGAFRYVLEPTGINWGTGGPYYLELTVEGQVLSPREEVGSSIYALHAKNVDDGSITPSKLVSGQKYEIIAATATSVDWSNIKNIPAGFADGVDDTGGDNLGNHIATTTLKMGNYAIITSSSVVGVTRIEWADGTVQVSSPQAGGAGGGADNLGNHTATQDLNMAGYNIVNISTITAQAEGIYLATNVFVTNGNLGIGTISPAFKLSIENNAGIIAKGTWNSGDTLPDLTNESLFIWYPKKSAFRAGWVGSDQWYDVNIGQSSVAMGEDTTASGYASTAMGYGTTASGYYSIAMGYGPTASGDFSTAMGYQTTASGDASTAMGANTTASGYASTAMGESTTASGSYSTAIGQYVRASDQNSIVIGKGINDSNRLVNNTANSFMVGFNRTTPTLFVSSSSVGINNTSMTPGLNVSTINYVSRIVWADGTVQVSSPQAGGGADNLGNHTATQVLNMSNFPIINISSMAAAGSLLISGNVGSTPTSGGGTRLMWVPAKSAFRAGYVDWDQWDDNYIGVYSVAMGYNPKAAGYNSVAIGENVEVPGNVSNAIIIGRGQDVNNPLVNDVSSSFAVGFGRTSPTFAVNQIGVMINGEPGQNEDLLQISTGATSLFRFQSDGRAKSLVSFDAGGADYAEWFEKEEEINPGDIVGLNLDTGKARKYQSGDVILGICSSNPGFVGNSNINKSDEEMKKDHVLVGLVGQLDFNKEQVMITGRKVQTKDGKQIGYLLANGKVLLKMQ